MLACQINCDKVVFDFDRCDGGVFLVVVVDAVCCVGCCVCVMCRVHYQSFARACGMFLAVT